MTAVFPCQGCGFLVLNGLPGTFAICLVSGWEDDNVQAADPFHQGGANGASLADHKRGVLRQLPAAIRECRGFRRDPGWPAAGTAAAPDAEPGAAADRDRTIAFWSS